MNLRIPRPPGHSRLAGFRGSGQVGPARRRPRSPAGDVLMSRSAPGARFARLAALAAAATLASIILPRAARSQGLVYPKAAKVDHVDDCFGTKVAAPYRWLEDDTASTVAAWVKAENALTF